MELSTDDNAKLKSFKNVKRYLHSHFHFLREAIRQHFQNIFLQDKKFKLQLSVENSHFSSHNMYNARVVDDTKANFIYSLSLVNGKGIAWEATTTMLLPGSVLCVSRDEFASCLFVTVKSQKPIFVDSVCILDVVIESETGDDSCLELYKNYDIIEAGEMGEVYKRTLALLKGFSRKKFLQTNLTFQEKSEKLPHYWDGKYEILKSKLSSAEFSKKVNDGNLNTSENEISGTETSEQLEIIPFNEEQKEAFLQALIKKVFLLKGSRGTGKTFVGLQLIKWLLQNAKNYIQGPILVVSYTSSNVNFILESSFKFTNNKVMKLGERSTKNALESYELCNIVEAIRSAKNMLAMESVLAESWLEKQNDFVKEQIRKIGLPLKNSDFKDEKYFDAMENLIRCISATEHILKEIKNYIYMADKHPLLNSRVLNPVIVIYNEFGFPEKYDAKLKFPIPNRTEVSPVGLNEENVVNEVKKWLCLSPSSVGQYRKIPEFCSSILMEVLHEMDMYHCIKGENYCRDNIPTFPAFAVEENGVGQLLSAICESIVEAADERTESSALSEKENASENEKAKKLGSFIKDYLSEDANAFSILERASLKCSLPQVLKGLDVWQLNLVDRWRLFGRWRRTVLEIWEGDLENLNAFYNALVEKLKIVEFFEAVHCMVDADVIGVTARDVAKYYEMLQILRPRVIIIDEASEIIENEEMISLVNNTDHLIAIGENQCSTVSSMNKVGNNSETDISLFERLIRGGAPSQTLNTQYGTRPSSEILVPKLYSDSINHLLSSTSENIRGVKENIFFLNHEKDIDMISEVEDYEAEFLLYFCHYLLEQNYLPCQVTILTFSICQMLLLRTKLHEKGICEVRATTVSDFRDEQSDIILLACSNGEDESGLTQFFPSEQGASIAVVSRAKKGLYCTGNFDAISAKYQYWKRIIEKVRQRQLIGKELALKCQTHPEVVAMVTSGKDFEKLFSSNNCFCVQCDSVRRQLSDESRSRSQSNKSELLDMSNSPVYRCTISSIKALFCGHTASLPCYVDPKTYFCEIQVQEELQCTHIILIPCFFQEYVDEIRSENIVKSTLQCGREYQYYPVAEAKKIVEEMNKCSHNERKNDREIRIVCKMKCNKRLSCGHRCVSSCVECYCRGNHEICPVEVEEIGQCGHIIKHKCGDPFYECMQKCKAILPCGHICSSPCFSLCVQQGYHEKCQVEVKHSFPCGHKENGLCGDPPPQCCSYSCDVVLPCGHPCSGFCSKCFERRKQEICTCTIFTTICGESFKGCEELCEKVLPCGHKCNGSCASCFGSNIHGPCLVEIEKKFPCGHEQTIECKDLVLSTSELYCRSILPCGHRCSGSSVKCTECNVDEFSMAKVQENTLCLHQLHIAKENPLSHYCNIRCGTILSCGHQCSGKCGQCLKSKSHKKCLMVKKVTLSCGHHIKIKCSQDLPLCKRKCKLILCCGHFCRGYCGQCSQRGKHEECEEEVRKNLPCGHTLKRKCGDALVLCNQTCTELLICGHRCNGTCGLCHSRGSHEKCVKRVKKKLPCGHQQNITCGNSSSQCSQTCNAKLSCGHRCFGTCSGCYQRGDHELCQKMVKRDLPCGHEQNCKCTDDMLECNLKCEVTLPCGHQCPGSCGRCYQQIRHDKCKVKLKTVFPCGHNRKVRCGNSLEKCPCKCRVALPCGHRCKDFCARCSESKMHRKCEKEITKILQCGHKRKFLCSDPSSVHDDETCDIILSCGHRCKGASEICCECSDLEVTELKSQKSLSSDVPCPTKLTCGHRCPGFLDKCIQLQIHEKCVKTVDTHLPCGHFVKKQCGSPLPACKEHCLFRCKHSECTNKCCSSCTKCEKPCEWNCEHHKCKQSCGDICDRPPCYFPCPKPLPCGHACVGFCGEPCPPLCPVCDVSNFPYKLTHADGRLKRYVLLEDCGHVAEFRYLQRYLQNNMSITGPRCPGCGSMITRNFRFGNMIKQLLQDMKRDPSEFFKNSTLEPNDWRCKILRGAVRTIRAKKKKKLITYSSIPQCVKMVCNIFIIVVIKDLLNSFPKPNIVLREKNKVILLEKWLWKHLGLASFQQIEESCRAVRRVALLTVLIIVEFNETFAPEPKKLLTEAKSLLESEDFGLGQEKKFLEIIHRMEETYFREYETLLNFNSSLKLP